MRGHLMVWAAALGLAAGLSACGHEDHGDHAGHAGHGDHAWPEVIAHGPTAGPFDTAVAEDLDPDPRVVEVALEAREAEVEVAPGRRMRMWTYNGVLPGPRIELRVGDTLRVHLTNRLPEPTTIHWHGLRVPADQDGVPATQAPVAPGASHTYQFTVPDAGTFWYHPHIRSDEQVERGLYGSIVVRGEDEPAADTDQVVVLDDALVGVDGQLSPFTAAEVMNGRQGNLLLVNGRAHPVLPLPAGGVHRLRLINAANARYFRLALPGHSLTWIASDAGLLPGPVPVEEVLLVPGERADVVVSPGGEPGARLVWQSLPYDRGHGSGALPGAEVFSVQVEPELAAGAPPLPARLADVPPLPAPAVERVLRLDEHMGRRPAGVGHGHGDAGGMGVWFSMNGKVHPDGLVFEGRLGDVESWRIENVTKMDHPFHLHGFRFQITHRGEVPEALRAWRDTINIPARSAVTVRMRLEDHPGRWMFHCHILEHAEHGMMGELVVSP